MASAVTNLAVQLTARTGKFAAQMNEARRPLMRLQSAARTVQRGFRIAFSVILARGFIGMLKSAVTRAQELGVRIDQISRKRIFGLTRSYQAFTHVMVRLGVRIASAVAPAVVNLLRHLTAAAMWLEQRLTPATIRNIGTVLKWAAALFVAVTAIRALIVIMKYWKTAMKGIAVAKAALLSLSGPAGWATLAVGAAAFGATLYGINKAFSGMADDASGANAEIKRLESTMRGLGSVGVGRLGIDFSTESRLMQSPTLRAIRALEQTNSASAAAEIVKLREDVKARADRQIDAESRRYTTLGTRGSRL